jgi:hypothetical protein
MVSVRSSASDFMGEPNSAKAAPRMAPRIAPEIDAREEVGPDLDDHADVIGDRSRVQHSEQGLTGVEVVGHCIPSVSEFQGLLRELFNAIRAIYSFPRFDQRPLVQGAPESISTSRQENTER